MDRTPLFVVGLDFGTTYSGYAFCSRHDYQQDPPKVFVNENWTAGGQGFSRKTPTSLLLSPEKEFCAFGYEAEEEYDSLSGKQKHKDYYFFRRFKMKLHGEEDVDDDFEIADELGKPLNAIEVFSKSIKYLKDHFMSFVKRTGMGIEDDEIRWILTVPAIWSDTAKFFMRRAAVKAGIKGNMLKICLEPEAASICCQHSKTERSSSVTLSNSSPGTKYMVIDLGGGTVDITVHKKLEEGKIGEVCKASGGPWGGTAIDEKFIQLITNIVGGPVLHRFRHAYSHEFLDMMREFEVAKRKVNAASSSNTSSTIKIKIPAHLDTICKEETKESIEESLNSENFRYKGQISVVADKLVFDNGLIQTLFMEVISLITNHVQKLLGVTETKDVSLIILAGGFAESPLLQEVFQDMFKTQNRRIIVSEEPGVSVLKGAVMFGHQPDQITSRHLRYTYGVAIKTEFINGQHPEIRKMTIENRDYCMGVFRVFIEKGTVVEKGYKIKKSYNIRRSIQNNVLRIYCSQNTNPSYIDDDGCKLVREIDLDHLLPALAIERYSFEVTHIFGDTEVEIEIRGKNFDFYFNDIFHYI